MASNFTYIVVAISSNFGSVIVARTGRQDVRKFRAIHSVTVWLSLGVALALGVVAPYLIPLVYGSGFIGSVYYLEIMLPGAVLWASSLVLCSGLVSLGRPGLVSVVQGTGGLFCAILLSLFLPGFGALGSAWISTGTYGAVWAVVLYLFCKESPRSLKPLFDLRVLRHLVRVHIDTKRS